MDYTKYIKQMENVNKLKHTKNSEIRTHTPDHAQIQ